MTDNSQITLHNGGGVTLTGDAITLYAEMSLRSAISLHQKTGMIPTRGVTITRMLARASQITGKPYKGKTKHDQAIADLTDRINAAKAAMPVEDNRDKA